LFYLEEIKIANAQRAYQMLIKNQAPCSMITGQTHLNPNTGRTLHDGVYLFPTD